MKTYLKIKAKSLAAESRMIRKEELKYTRGNHPLRVQLRLHRLGLRAPMRETYLAYAFLRNRSYSALEGSRKSEPNWEQVWRLVVKYGAPYFGKNITMEKSFKMWKET